MARLISELVGEADMTYIAGVWRHGFTRDECSREGFFFLLILEATAYRWWVTQSGMPCSTWSGTEEEVPVVSNSYSGNDTNSNCESF